jgi:hypothetical protein
MSSLALNYGGALLGGRGSPPAGETGNAVVKAAVDALGALKRGVAAGSSWVFNDLQALAQESGASFRDDATFAVAQRFLLTLPGFLPAAELSLDEDGEVAFDWRGEGERMLTLRLRSDGRLTYACRLAPLRRKHGTELFVDAVPKEIVECIQQVAGGR